jgi:parallel beta-helix repeat protein
MGKYFKIILLLSLFFTTFAGTKTSDLSQETSIQDTDEVIIRRGSNNYRAQVQHLPSAQPPDQFSKIKNAYYVSTNASITDHGDTAQSGSIADVITNEMSGAQGNIILPGNTTYQIKQALTIPTTAQFLPQKGGIIDTDISIRDANYKWTLSGSGTNEYYLEAAAGGNPNINEPDDVAEDNSLMTEAIVGTLSAGEWDWGNNDTLGYNTVYVRLSDSTDPDGKAADYVEACYNLIMNGALEVGPYQIISGNGRVTALKKVKSIWFPSLTTAVATGAKEVHITPNVTHTITTTCLVSNGQMIYGNGDTSLIEFGANIDGFTIDGKSNIILKDFKIDGKKSIYTSVNNEGITSPANGTGSSNIRIDGLTIVDVAGSSIQILAQTGSHSENIKILNCSISDSGAHGIVCQDYVDDVIVSGNRVIDYAEGVNDRVGIVIGRSAVNQQIIGNHVESDGGVLGGSSCHGISLDRTTYAVVANNVVKNASSYGIEVGLSQQVSVTGNEIYSSGRPGITVVGDESERVCKHVTVSGNTIFEPALLAGIYVHTSNYVATQGEDITIVGNTIHNNQAGPGIYVMYAKNGVVSGNTIIDSYLAGIRFEYSDFFNVHGNLIKNANTSDSAGHFYGVSEHSSCSNITINGRIEVDSSATTTVGAGEDDLKSFTIPQETYNDWRGMRVIAGGLKYGAGGDKTIKFYIGASVLTFHVAANDTNDWQFVADIPFYLTNTANDAFRFTWKGYNGTTLTQGYEAWAVDTTTASATMKITGECASAADSIVQNILIIDFY